MRWPIQFGYGPNATVIFHVNCAESGTHIILFATHFLLKLCFCQQDEAGFVVVTGWASGNCG